MLKLTGVCILILSFLFPAELFAQGKQISGTVTSSENSQPASGITVTEKGKRNSTTTDAQGNYKITVADDATLVFSSASFVSYEISVAGKTTVSV